jgi:hypothetical protein
MGADLRLGTWASCGPHHERISLSLRRPQDPLDGDRIDLLSAARVSVHVGDGAAGDFFSMCGRGWGRVDERSA